MTISKKITRLNNTTLESLNESSETSIVGKFTEAGIKILGADFGFAYWKTKNEKQYRLVYKSSKMSYEPRLPRKKGYSYFVEKTKKPYLGNVKKERLSKYDMSRYMKSIIIVPIYYKNKQYGNLVLCYKKTRKFSAEDRSLSEALGNAAAQTITIHGLYHNLQLAKQSLESRVQTRTRQLEQSNRKLAQEKAEEEALLTSIGEAIIATDQDGKIILLNPAARELKGIRAGQHIGKNIFEVQTLFDQNNQEIPRESRPIYSALFKGKKMVTSASKPLFLERGGERLPVSITATPIFLEEKIIGAIQVLRDVSEETRIDKAKSELISLVSHQLRTPLSAINWYSEVLLNQEIGKLNPQQKKYLREVFEANQKMIELVYDFLNVSRIELGTFTLMVSEVNVVTAAREVLTELGPALEEKKIKVEQKFSPELESLILDKKIIRIIFQNLLSNSVKYTRREGKVEITGSLDQAGQNLLIAVKDNGYGIPKAQQGKIFTKLFRADNVQSLDTRGSGLGLYITKSLVDFCGGKISFKSVQHKGSHFTVTLPLSAFKQIKEVREAETA